MSFLTTLPAAIVETILIRLTALFLTGASGDMAAARHAAVQILGTYHPETEDELRLAANIVCFGFQAIEALGQAATQDLPLTRILRLRGGAVSLSRESAKAERRLAQLQKGRHQAIPTQSAERQPEPVPKIEKAVALIKDIGKVTMVAKAHNLTWTQAYQQRQRDTRIAASLKKAKARIAAIATAATSDPAPNRQGSEIVNVI